MALHNLLENGEAALAALSAVLSAAGLLLCIAAYAFVFLSLQSADSTVSQQIDSVSLTVGDAQSVVAAAALSAQNASGAISSFSAAIAAYSQATANTSSSMGDIARVAPFSLDNRFSSAAASMGQASGYFADAAVSANASAGSAQDAASAMQKAALDLQSARAAVGSAKEGFRNAIGMLQLAALGGALALCALFSSVLALSLSVLLTHYPRLFERKTEHGEKKQ